jgi:uncharacterized protein
MTVAVMAWDGPGGTAIREAARETHFAYIATIIDRIAVAGPLKDASGTNIGSLLVYKTDSVPDALALFEGDPYFQARLWDRWTINAFLPAAGEWVGGTIW